MRLGEALRGLMAGSVQTPAAGDPPDAASTSTEADSGSASETGCLPNDLPESVRDDLRKPERLVSPGGQVSVAATRDEAGHADHFWAVALALRASTSEAATGAFTAADLKSVRLGRNHSRIPLLRRPLLNRR